MRGKDENLYVSNVTQNVPENLNDRKLMDPCGNRPNISELLTNHYNVICRSMIYRISIIGDIEIERNWRLWIL